MRMRPANEGDIEQLHELSQLTKHGLTTLPKDRSMMEKRVRQSERSFQHLEDADPSGQLYLFVLEDTEKGRVAGTSGIVSKVGGFKPFYAYQLKHESQYSESLDHQVTHPVLHLVKEHDGPSEIGSLFVHPDYRSGGNGRLLSLGRFLFMAIHPHLFENEVIAEMRGVIDEQGNSPFWDAIGSHFFPLDLPNADMLSLNNKDFIDELMPKHPIYVDLLSTQAQQTVGQVHENTGPARGLLESEGFRFRDLVDIFEAGPVLHCQREEIRSIHQSRQHSVDRMIDQESVSRDAARVHCVVAAAERPFRAVLAEIIESESGVTVSRQAAQDLAVGIGDCVRIVDARPSR